MDENTVVTNQAGGQQTPPQNEQAGGQQTPPQNEQAGGQQTPPQNEQAGGQQTPPQNEQAGGQQTPPQNEQAGGQQTPPQNEQAGGYQAPPQGYPDMGPAAGMNQPGAAPKKKNGAVAAIVIVCVLIVLLAVGAVAMAMTMFSSPKSKVFKAMAATMADGDKSFAEYLGTAELAKMTTGGKYSSELELVFESMDDGYEDYSMLSGIGISADNSVDYEAKKLTSDINLLYNGSKLLNMNLFADDTLIGVSMPDLYEGSLAFDTETFMRDCNEFYNNYYGYTYFDEEYSFNVFTAKPDEEIFEERYAEDLKNIYKAIEVTKTSEKRTVSVKGRDQECRGYEVVIPQKATEVFLMDLFDYLKKSASGDEQGSYDELRDTLIGILDEDIVAMVYLDKGGRMVALEQEGDLTYEGETIGLETELEWTGENHLWDDFTMETKAHDETTDETILLSANHTLENVEGEIQQKLTVDLTNESLDETIYMEYKASQDTEAGGTRLMLRLGMDDEEYIRMDLEGAFDEVKAGQQYRFDMDSLDLSLNNDDVLISLSGSYAIGGLKDEIEIEQGELRYILEMNESELEDLGLEIYENLMSSPLVNLMMGY